MVRVMCMFVLFISLFSLIVGVLIAPKIIRYAKSVSFFEGFISVFIGGLVLFHIFPHSFTDVGYWALPFFVLGAFIPFFLEQSEGSGVLTLIFLGAGFSIHAFMDGLGLQLHDALVIHDVHEHEHEQTTLVWAILAHRVPVGLFLGCAAIQRPKLSYSVVFLIAMATVAGFFLGSTIPYIGTIQAVIAGALLHVIAGHRVLDPHIPQDGILRVIGALSAGSLLFFVSDSHMESLFLECWFFASLFVLTYFSLQAPKHECELCTPAELPST